MTKKKTTKKKAAKPTPFRANVAKGETVHWYLPDGSAVVEVPKAGKLGMPVKDGGGGETKAPTIREAKIAAEAGEPWLPGATGPLKVLDKPALVPYFKMQVIESVLGNPKLEEWSAGEIAQTELGLRKYIAGLLRDSGDHARNARDMGSEGHGAIANSFAGAPYSAEWVEIVQTCQRMLTNLAPFHNWALETTYASRICGWGGTIDAHSPILTKRSELAFNLVDFKGRDFDEEDIGTPKDDEATRAKKRTAFIKKVSYPDDVMQLCAYSCLLHDGLWTGRDRLFNFYFSRNDEGREKGLVVAVEHADAEQNAVHMMMYRHAYEIWCLQRRYDPREKKEA